MEVGSEGLVILFAIIIGGYYIINMYNEKDLVQVTSSVDNEKYTVQIKDDSKEAADLIAKIKQRLITLLEHMERKFGSDDERVANLKINFKPNRLKEGVETPGYTSYSINKGEQIVLCLRNNDKLVDINTMMFVVLHEYAHLASVSIGHTQEFWDNFRWILEEAINIGIYVKQDFNKKSVEYCGMDITSSPLD
uniref:WLM domain protein n=1 Tax=Virus NIOZ-UU159 TaxID=2763270 RepID=A0A7S9XG02_9VIRU|nr:MAG: WLM domain protein [Virus NIOZ-UU159]